MLMIASFVIAAIVCAGCTGTENAQEQPGPEQESVDRPASPADPALEIKRVLSGIEPDSAILLRLVDRTSIVGVFIAVDDTTITITQRAVRRAVESRTVIEISIPVDASRGTNWERVYLAK
jgi:hypothetical protein